MEQKLKAEKREGTGSGVAIKLRAAGRVPAVLYGQGIVATSISVDAKDLYRLLHTSAGTNVLVDLVVDGEEHLAIPREIQRDHIHSKYVHVDFFAVSRDEKITVNVEVAEVGEAAGVKAGGVIEHHLREVEVECLPTDVPDRIEADVTALEIGDMIRVGDLAVPKGVTILTAPEIPILSVITPAALRVEADLTLPGEEAPEVEAPVEEAAAEPAAEETPAPPSEEGGES